MGLRAECIGGGEAYVGHGADCVLLAFTPEVGWWRNSVGLAPDQARALAAVLIEQADAAEACEGISPEAPGDRS